ncbi:hypothetical protein [Natranaerobius thermophilus]|uniref:Uncharacterized protein n=1 Tax=Natranaerobius thermophilus (strain ATCC BAA-1301 / DSM 18059 / JW/NM-WN-LF) TaxID=457570 RepID=B2A8P8_NATTJ|nr:hypothetical protein [Natranaerobius thermophilus]ACB86497.1 hypothetical protein Nther_2952 [Natranaerobius thermophilus JW/NM-WN-LF]
MEYLAIKKGLGGKKIQETDKSQSDGVFMTWREYQELISNYKEELNKIKNQKDQENKKAKKDAEYRISEIKYKYKIESEKKDQQIRSLQNAVGRWKAKYNGEGNAGQEKNIPKYSIFRVDKNNGEIRITYQIDTLPGDDPISEYQDAVDIGSSIIQDQDFEFTGVSWTESAGWTARFEISEEKYLEKLKCKGICFVP